MKIQSMLTSTVDSYDNEKAVKWLYDWVKAWEDVGWTCVEWKMPSDHTITATVTCEIEVGDDD